MVENVHNVGSDLQLCPLANEIQREGFEWVQIKDPRSGSGQRVILHIAICALSWLLKAGWVEPQSLDIASARIGIATCNKVRTTSESTRVREIYAAPRWSEGES